MLKWSMELIELPLKFDWSISRNTSVVKRNFIIRVKDTEDIEGLGEVAFNVRYGESEEGTKKDFQQFIDSKPLMFHSLEDFAEFCSPLNISNSLSFGLESALADYLCQKEGRTLSSLLGLKDTTSAATSFSLPIMKENEIAKFIDEHELKRFSRLKIKVEKSSAIAVVKEVLRCYSGKLRIDANESWVTAREVLEFADAVGTDHFDFIEQPLPAHLVEEAKKLKEANPCHLIGDESITSDHISNDLVECFHGVNIKLMKSGGYLKALEQLKRARGLGLTTMIGCMIETSLGISSALKIGEDIDFFDLDGHLLIKSDPFGLLLERSGSIYLNNRNH